MMPLIDIVTETFREVVEIHQCNALPRKGKFHISRSKFLNYLFQCAEEKGYRGTASALFNTADRIIKYDSE